MVIKKMNNIHVTLRQKETQIARLQDEIKVLRAAARIIHADHRGSGSERAFRTLSQPKMIRQVLLKRGRPLHADKIAAAIAKTFNVKLKRSDITSVIYRAIRRKKFFRKEGNNTFGLVEWPGGASGRQRN